MSFGQLTDTIVAPRLLLSSPALIDRSALSVSIFFAQPATARATGTTATRASRRRIRGGHVSRAIGPKGAAKGLREARGCRSVGLSDRIAATPGCFRRVAQLSDEPQLRHRPVAAVSPPQTRQRARP